MRFRICALLLAATAANAEPKTVTWTGWFSDLQCASGQVGHVYGNQSGLRQTLHPIGRGTRIH
jgi:hypothetical protein